MSLATLHCICLDRIYGYLKKGSWKFCTTNPFSKLPSHDVNRLAQITLLNDSEDPPKFGDFSPILTSGRLTQLDLRPFYPDAEYDFIVKAIQKGHIISLQNRASKAEKVIFHLVRNAISWNPYLEELHLGIDPGFDVIRKCQNLRILRMYCSFSSLLDKNVPIDLSALSSLRNLEVLYIPDMDIETIANVLETCPKLISIGLNDSLDSLEEIAQRRQKNSLSGFDVGGHFQLRRCAWGDRSLLDPHERCLNKSRLFCRMRFAVALCPLVQELIFYVHAKNAMGPLKFLKHLTFLSIDFSTCKEDFLRNFVVLLLDLGKQLKHLSIIGLHRYPVDIICFCCPHLQSLEIYGYPFVKDSTEDPGNLPLKRLRLQSLYASDDKESLLYLLSNCKLLEELFLCEVGSFDDVLLSEIFQRNPFTELKVSCIEYCSLTREGYKMFIEKAASIETVIIWDLENCLYDVNRLVNEPNLRYLKNVDIRMKEFFNIEF
ncbi:hypothetical protein AVEN_104005-1 [Araneus ventricosus]|uniref:F-box domain-containing protein n=1 Tax=Araneus ventricosus TaxID=182803 RepID=A0A4Y2P5R0_ARAVE|nr:hypothetical protein AVEN_104005-1 [Araneus ventricosus]